MAIPTIASAAASEPVGFDTLFIDLSYRWNVCGEIAATQLQVPRLGITRRFRLLLTVFHL
jgi:hypothetical protein